MKNDPTTVRGWLETLPEPLRAQAMSQCTTPNSFCANLSDAIEYFNEWTKTNEGHSFWGGVLWFIMGRNGTSLVHEIDGYNAAKAAYEDKANLDYLDAEPCGVCHRSGWAVQFSEPCTNCNGSGLVSKRQETESTNGKEKCNWCEGNFESSPKDCPMCKVYEKPCAVKGIWDGKSPIETREVSVLDALTRAWSEYISLEVQHPSEQQEFQNSIHRCQELIAIRVARRVCPEIFPRKEQGNG